MTKKYLLEWTGYAESADIANYMENYNEQIGSNAEDWIDFKTAEEMMARDDDYWYQQWDYFTEAVTDLMDNKEHWIDNASRIGWRSLSGHKVFKADNGEDFIRRISPDTDCMYRISKYYSGFKIRISHHDAPMGELHIVKPISEKLYQKLTDEE